MNDLRLLLHFHYRNFNAHASTFTTIKESYSVFAFPFYHFFACVRSMMVAFHVPFTLSLYSNVGASSYLASSPPPITVHGTFETTLVTCPQNALAFFNKSIHF